jgi:membrane associated rhomboid family serine protease
MISPRFLTALGVAALAGCGLLSALLELYFVPLYSGATLVPVTVAFALIGNVVLLYLGRDLVPDSRWRVAPFVAWLIPVIVFTLFTRPEGDVILPAGDLGLEWTGYGVALGGTLTGIIAAVVFSPPPRQRPARPTQPTQPTRPTRPTRPTGPLSR